LEAAAEQRGPTSLAEQLSGYVVNPLVISTTGSVDFKARIDPRDREISHTLSYAALEGDVLQAHIHGREGAERRD
jgi:hypothetical protein